MHKTLAMNSQHDMIACSRWLFSFLPFSYWIFTAYYRHCTIIEFTWKIISLVSSATDIFIVIFRFFFFLFLINSSSSNIRFNSRKLALWMCQFWVCMMHNKRCHSFFSRLIRLHWTLQCWKLKLKFFVDIPKIREKV